MRLAHDTSACAHQQLPQLPAVLGAALHLPGIIAATVEQAPGALIDLLETAAAWHSCGSRRPWQRCSLSVCTSPGPPQQGTWR